MFLNDHLYYKMYLFNFLGTPKISLTSGNMMFHALWLLVSYKLEEGCIDKHIQVHSWKSPPSEVTFPDTFGAED